MTMRAMVLSGVGSLGHLAMGEMPVPRPGPDEVLIEVATVAVNQQDGFAIRGDAQIPELSFPHVLGNDPAGRIAAIGDEVEGVKVGDRVVTKPAIACGECVYCHLERDADCTNLHIVGVHRHGGHAEYVTVPATNVFPIPDTVGFADATALAQSFPVALNMLRNKAQVTSSDVVLVSGASGSVGSAAVQLAKSIGATVIAAASSAERVAFAQDLGADFGVDYGATGGFASIVRDAFPNGVTIYLETAANPRVWTESLRTLADHGRVVVCGAHAGPIVEVDLKWLFRSRAHIMGSASSSREDFAEMLDLAARGEITPSIDSIRPLEEMVPAFERLLNRQNQGKVVLTVSRAG